MASQNDLDEKTSLLSSIQGMTKMLPSFDTQDLSKDNLLMTLRGRSSPTALLLEADVIDLRQRLTIRQYLHSRLAAISDIMSFLAILSIFLMILSNELTFVRENNAPTRASWWINLLNTFITIILLGMIIYYQYYSLKLFANHNSFQDARIGLTIGKAISILVELIVCAIHPVPQAYPKTNPPMLDLTVTDEYNLSYMPTDIALSLPMFLRLYLLSRSIMYHSDLVRNSSMRSFGYMNKVTINFYFLFKTYLDIWATRSLLVICGVWLFVGSWSLRACDYNANQHITMADSIWLFICTLAAIGYGEIYPTTYCARTIAGVIGLSGLLISALLITVLEQKCSLTRQENYVHTFVMSSELANDLKESAANVVKYAVKLWYLKKKNIRNYLHRLRVQQRLFQEINVLKALKIEKRVLADNYAGIEEIMTLQQRMGTQYEGLQQKTVNMEKNVTQMNTKLDTIEQQMTTLQSSMNTLLDQMKKQTFV